MDPLPMAPSCALDEAGLREQLARYRRAGERARLLARTPDRLVVELDARADTALIEEAIAIEQACCPFFAIGWQPDSRRLSFSVSDAAHGPALDAIAFALDVEPAGAR
jgi:hypothetical protein